MVIFEHLWGQMNLEFIKEYWWYVSVYIMPCLNTESLYGKSVCTELTRGFVSFYIMRSSNTKSLYGKIMYAELTWKICFLIHHAVIKYKAGTRQDISCWHQWLFWSENNHLWPSFYCIFIVFPFDDYSWSSCHLPHLFYLIIRKEKHESHLESVSELSAFL